MKKVLGTGVVAVALLAANIASALTDKNVFKCEDKAVAAVNKWGGARGKCLTKCQLKKVKEGPTSTRVCSNPPGLDSETATCTTTADQKYVTAAVAACPTGTFPTCGPYAGENPTTYANGQIIAQSGLVDATTVPLLICNDAAAKCEGKVVGSLAKLSAAVGKCLAKCYKALQVKGDTTLQCTPQAPPNPFAPLDVTTKGCIDAAVAAATTAIGAACPTLPPCGIYLGGPTALLGLVTDNIAGNYATPSSNPYCTLP